MNKTKLLWLVHIVFAVVLLSSVRAEDEKEADGEGDAGTNQSSSESSEKSEKSPLLTPLEAHHLAKSLYSPLMEPSFGNFYAQMREAEACARLHEIMQIQMYRLQSLAELGTRDVDWLIAQIASVQATMKTALFNKVAMSPDAVLAHAQGANPGVLPAGSRFSKQPGVSFVSPFGRRDLLGSNAFGDLGGSVGRSLGAASSAFECESRCALDTNCQAYTYLPSQAGMCYAVGIGEPLAPYPNMAATSGVKQPDLAPPAAPPVKPDDPPFILQLDVNHAKDKFSTALSESNDPNYMNLKPADSYSTCQDRCDANGSCLAFTFIPPDDDQRLGRGCFGVKHPSALSNEPHDGARSGVRRSWMRSNTIVINPA